MKQKIKKIFSDNFLWQQITSISISIFLTLFGLNYNDKIHYITTHKDITMFAKFRVWLAFPTWIIIISIIVYVILSMRSKSEIERLKNKITQLYSQILKLKNENHDLISAKFNRNLKVINTIKDDTLRDKAKYATVMSDFNLTDVEFSDTIGNVKVVKK